MTPSPLWTIAEDQAVTAKLAELFSFEEISRHPTYGGYGTVGSSRLNKATHDAIQQAHSLAEERFEITQGGLNGGAVATSAATHNGLGVLDTRRAGIAMTMPDAFRVVAFGMDCGAVGFIRGVEGVDNMVDHIHWVMVGAQKTQHPSTADQIYDRDYGYAYNGGGLAGASRTRWYGPPRRPLVTWAQSRYNPQNGWKP